jgi:orotate phosphoribosyltransferase
MTEASRERLLALLHTHSFKRGRFTLASGRESDFFIDCKQTVLLAEGHALVAQLMLQSIERLPRSPQAVAGVALGGCPLASAVAMGSAGSHRPLDAVYVRKSTKEHGSKRTLEGDGHLAQGAPIVVLEDTVTTGGSTLQAVERLRERGLDVVGVIALVDRREGGAQAIEAHGLHFSTIFGREDFIPEPEPS